MLCAPFGMLYNTTAMYIHVLTFVSRDYASLVGAQVREAGLVVETQQLSPTVSLADALDSAAHRGLLYAIIITSQHEMHRSVTLTILHGRNPQGIGTFHMCVYPCMTYTYTFTHVHMVLRIAFYLVCCSVRFYDGSSFCSVVEDEIYCPLTIIQIMFHMHTCTCTRVHTHTHTL